MSVLDCWAFKFYLSSWNKILRIQAAQVAIAIILHVLKLQYNLRVHDTFKLPLLVTAAECAFLFFIYSWAISIGVVLVLCRNGLMVNKNSHWRKAVQFGFCTYCALHSTREGRWILGRTAIWPEKGAETLSVATTGPPATSPADIIHSRHIFCRQLMPDPTWVIATSQCYTLRMFPVMRRL